LNDYNFPLTIETIWAVYNSDSLYPFIKRRAALKNRLPKISALLVPPTKRNAKGQLIPEPINQAYEQTIQNMDEACQKVIETLKERIKEMNWNDFENKIDELIIPMVHGTTLETAIQICATGFAQVRRVRATDRGWYGNGIYFTSQVSNAVYYACAALKKGSDIPALIITWVIPGLINPVTSLETFKDGKPVERPFNSNYVLTDLTGTPYQRPNKISKPGSPPIVDPTELHSPELCHPQDELVLDQEVYALPAFVVELRRPETIGQGKDWYTMMEEYGEAKKNKQAFTDHAFLQKQKPKRPQKTIYQDKNFKFVRLSDDDELNEATPLHEMTLN